MTLTGFFIEASYENWVRRRDLNLRPLGYGPSELPTAPLRHIMCAIPPFSRSEGAIAAHKHPRITVWW